MKRSREVGLRKVVGAFRGQLIGQFLSESVLLTLMSLLLALGSYVLSVALLWQTDGETNRIKLFFKSNSRTGLTGSGIIVGLFSGSYPALIMSSLRPAQVLKGNGETFSGSRLQRWLIVVQYAVSITLVISSLVIYRQLAYMQDRELGYSKTNIITIRLRDDALFDNRQNLKNDVGANPNIFRPLHPLICPSTSDRVRLSTMIRRK